VSRVATIWVDRVGLTLAYARMSGRDSWAILALVMGRKFWKTVIAVGREMERRQRKVAVV
jgi:hypothetical protein